MANGTIDVSRDSPDSIFRRTRAVDRGQGLGAIARITRMTLRYPVRVALALLATVLASSMQLSIPMILGRAVDRAQAMAASGAADNSAARAGLLTVALMLLGASVLRGLFTLVQNYTAESVGHAISRDLRLAVYDKIQRLPFSFHDRTHSGDLITVGMLDLEGVRMYFSTALRADLPSGPADRHRRLDAAVHRPGAGPAGAVLRALRRLARRRHAADPAPDLAAACRKSWPCSAE